MIIKTYIGLDVHKNSIVVATAHNDGTEETVGKYICTPSGFQIIGLGALGFNFF